MPKVGSWMLLNADLVRPGMRVLDVACGDGRHAVWLAGRGCHVQAVDRDAQRIAGVRQAAARLALAIDARVLDLEAGSVDLGTDHYDLILVIHYLHRPLFPALRRALAPGGVLLYETFTVGQAARGRPTNPDFLLRPGELRALVAPLAVIREREGEFEERMVSAVAAVKQQRGGKAVAGGPRWEVGERVECEEAGKYRQCAGPLSRSP